MSYIPRKKSNLVKYEISFRTTNFCLSNFGKSFSFTASLYVKFFLHCSVITVEFPVCRFIRFSNESETHQRRIECCIMLEGGLHTRVCVCVCGAGGGVTVNA